MPKIIIKCCVPAQSPYVALLNDDIELHEDALDNMVAYLDANPQVGLVGPQQFNEDGSFQVAFYSDPTLLRMVYKISGLATLTTETSRLRKFLQKMGIGNLLNVESLKTQHTTRQVDIIKGAVMLVRRDTYQQVGMLDEDLNFYGEEAEWHWRLRRAGWKVVFVAESSVTHFRHTQGTLRLNAHQLTEDRRAILNYFLKHRPSWQAILIRAAIALSHSFWGTVWLPFSPERSRVHFNIVQIGLQWSPPSLKR